MADRALSSAAWIARQNAEREERNKSAREKAEEMTEGTRRKSNLDTGNKFIVLAAKKNMELTDEAQRDRKWQEEYQIILDNLQAINEAEKKGHS